MTYSYWGTRVVLAMDASIRGMVTGAVLLGVLAWLGLDAAGFVALGVATLYGGWRGARVRVVADADGLTVHNPFSTERIPWQSIQRITVGSSASIRLPCPRVVRNDDGRPVKLLAMTYWDRLISSDDARSAVRFRAVVRGWQRDHSLPGDHR